MHTNTRAIIPYIQDVPYKYRMQTNSVILLKNEHLFL